MSPRFSESSKSPETTGRAPRLIVSFHDLHPGSRSECERLLAALRPLGIHRVSLLVVPQWHGAPAFTEDREFTKWLKELEQQGHEICLHGYFHRATHVEGGMINQLIARRYTQSEGEFFQIEQADAERRIAAGLELLRVGAQLEVVGFTPPAWLISNAGREALMRAGLAYTTTWKTVDLLDRGEIISAPTVVYSCRNAWRRAVSLAWAQIWSRFHRAAPVLRIAIHPPDLGYPAIERSFLGIAATAMKAGREPITYAELAAEHAASTNA